MKSKVETKKFSREANIRDYRYTVTVNKKTGAVIKIEAGCRTWQSFREATDHYRAEGHLRWSDAWIKRNCPYSADRTRAERIEAQEIIFRLNCDVAVWNDKRASAAREERRKWRKLLAEARQKKRDLEA